VTEAAFFVLRPSNVIALFLIGGLILVAAGRCRGGIGLVAAGTFGYVVLGFVPVGKMALGVLEDRFPKPDPAAVAPAGILVLGGAIVPDVTAARGEIALNEASERIVATAALAKSYPRARILVSGGPERHPGGAVIGAPLVAELLTAFGVEEARIELEPKSRNTWENVTFSKRIAQPRAGETWLVVTSAWHMPRAIGALRAAGWEAPMAWPVDYRSAGEGLADVTPASADGLQHANLAAREFLGLLAYRLTGRSSELLPGPAPTGSR
jgi:uncharacterized SAM-binding protein YcdF (DUF218 family)